MDRGMHPYYFDFIKMKKLLYYETDDVVMITTHKVGSRFCEEIAHKDGTQLCVNEKNEFIETKGNGKDYVFDGLKKMMEGREKRKIIFLFRHPYKRIVSAFNHLFNEWMKNDLNHYISFEKNPVLRSYNFWNNPKSISEDIKLGIKDKIKTHINFYLHKGIQDIHMENYLYLYDEILTNIELSNNFKGWDNIHLVNLDKYRIEDVLKINESIIKRGKEMASNLETKLLAEAILQEDYKMARGIYSHNSSDLFYYRKLISHPTLFEKTKI